MRWTYLLTQIRGNCCVTFSRSFCQETLLGPTAAEVPVAGKVVTSAGGPVKNAVVSLADDSGNTLWMRTNVFGNFRFDGIEIGSSFVLSVRAKGLTFQPQTLTVIEKPDPLVIRADP